MSTDPLEVSVDHNLCRGSHSCMRRAPGSFSQDEAGKAVYRPGGADEKDVLAAAAACPTFAIQVAKGGKLLA